ncbi:MAG: gliding motility-associated protein GldE [Sphingobacteriales bacterium]
MSVNFLGKLPPFNIPVILLNGMPQTTVTILFVLVLLLLVISFVVSGSVVAYFTLSYKEINGLKIKPRPSSKRILELIAEPRSLQATLFIVHTLCNISVVILSNFLMDELISASLPFLITLLIKIFSISVVLILFTEMLPKLWATQNNLRFAFYTSFIVSALHLFFKGVSSWAVRYAEGIENSLGKSRNSYTSEELDQAIEMTSSEDATEEEKNILKGVVKFGHITVKQVMRSRMQVHGIDHALTFNEVVSRVEELSYSRLPVYQNDMDKIVGILHTKDIIPHIHQATDYNWHSLIRPAYFVHENRLIEDLLKEFQQSRIHFAVVIDEFGGTEGIVTLEDILEEIIGDIRDEFDEEDSSSKRIDENNFQFEGKSLIIDACKFMDLAVDTFDEISGESETMAGLLLEITGEIPKAGQEIRQGDFLFKVLEVNKNRIDKLMVTIIRQS